MPLFSSHTRRLYNVLQLAASTAAIASTAGQEKNLKTTDLSKRINGIVAIDTHTHIGKEGPGAAWKLGAQLKRVLFWNYPYQYLAAAGADLDDPALQSAGIEEVLVRLAPYWERIRATGTGGATLESFRDLYGFDGDFGDRKKVAELVKKIAAAYKGGEQNRWTEVFRKVNVELAMKNVELTYFTDYLPSQPPRDAAIERKLIRAIPRIDSYLFGPFRLEGSRMLELSLPGMNDALAATIAALRAKTRTLPEYLDMIRAAFRAYKRHGAVAVKMTIAYLRDLTFEDAPKAAAEKVFRNRAHVRDLAAARPFQAYVLRFILDRCAEHDLPIQIHTGLQAGNDSNMPECNPITLTNLFRDERFRRVRFVLLHGGYPYTGEMGVLARSFPNVYLDFAWLPLLSPAMCARCLEEWLEFVPSSKLMHGADVHTAEDMYVVTRRARRIIAEVLGRMVDAGRVKAADALAIARRILRENAIEVYRLDV
jgi:predicted TIM-barrel fold metal-dependent hydrolase